MIASPSFGGSLSWDPIPLSLKGPDDDKSDRLFR